MDAIIRPMYWSLPAHYLSPPSPTQASSLEPLLSLAWANIPPLLPCPES